MEWLRELGRRLGILIRGERFDRDLQEEMRLHIELRQQEHMGRGLAAEDAHAAAQRKFGNATLLREASGDVWGWRWLENIGKDLRLAPARCCVRRALRLSQ